MIVKLGPLNMMSSVRKILKRIWCGGYAVIMGRDGLTREELRNRFGVERLSKVMRIGKLCWFCYVEKKNENA